MDASAKSPSKATRREWIGLAVLALPCLLYSMDLNVLNLAIPALTAELRPTATQLLWIVDVYGFLLAGFLIAMGTLGDRIGRRRLLMIGAAAFGAASVLAAFSTSAEMLIVARAVLGIAAATLAPSTLSLIRNMFLDDRERTVAIGVWVGCFSAGSVVGPVLGGVLLEYYWWGSVFLLAVPVMALLLVVGPRLLPEFRDPDAGQLDLRSATLATATVLALIYGMKRTAVHGADAAAAIAIVVGVAIGAAFVRRQRALAQPMIDLTLFRRPRFGAALVVNVLGVFAAFGSFLFITQYLQLVRGFGPLAAGLILAPMGIVFAGGAVVAPLLVRRIPAGTVLAGAFLVTAAGYVLIAQCDADTPLPLVAAGLALFCAGLAPFGTLTTDLVMSAVPPEKAGAASGLSETSFEFGAALGVAVLGSILTAVYRARLDAADLPALSAGTLADVRETLGSALAAADAVGGASAEALRIAARAAFSDAMQVAAWVSAALAVATALLCVAAMRTPRAAAARGGDR